MTWFIQKKKQKGKGEFDPKSDTLSTRIEKYFNQNKTFIFQTKLNSFFLKIQHKNHLYL